MSRMSEMRGRTPPPPDEPTKLAVARRAVARGDLRKIPSYGEVWIEILGNAAMERIEAATLRHMTSIGIPATALHGGSYNLQRFARVLAEAIRDPADPSHATPFGTLAEWQDELEMVLSETTRIYLDVKRAFDPSGLPNDLAPGEAEEIEEAFKKKDVNLLRSFDGDSLIAWLLTGAVQLSSSPTAVSKSSEPSPG